MADEMNDKKSNNLAGNFIILGLFLLPAVIAFVAFAVAFRGCG